MGRPRKYPKKEDVIISENNNATIEVVVKKKRGRKPKIRTPEELA